jgi:tRNA dimethylallyltransferase
MELLTSHQWQAKVSDLLAKSKKPLIVVLGPTASGKTAFSIEIAKFIGSAEIINGDSRQLYHHLDIGTAKISEEEKKGIAHHLFSVLDPEKDVTIADYKKMAMDMIDDCHARNVAPILVGGSMLYISAIVDGLDPLPPADPTIRERLEQEWDKDDGWTLYDKLVEIDPDTAKSFEKQNKRYVVRAMELYEMTGKKPSTLKKTIPPPYDILQFGMHWPREELTKRIDERTKILLQSGWIEEVEGLIDRGYTLQTPAMKSHGYREIMQWLGSEEKNTEALEEVIAAKTRQYAKRQMTWWEQDDRIKWIDTKEL